MRATELLFAHCYAEAAEAYRQAMRERPDKNYYGTMDTALLALVNGSRTTTYLWYGSPRLPEMRPEAPTPSVKFSWNMGCRNAQSQTTVMTTDFQLEPEEFIAMQEWRR
ncbi:MAG: hypothetical protein JWR26_438 [Pedosphaera sp.]|nr:hypothetical protein [Pedosphaera sp.]